MSSVIVQPCRAAISWVSCKISGSLFTMIPSKSNMIARNKYGHFLMIGIGCKPGLLQDTHLKGAGARYNTLEAWRRPYALTQSARFPIRAGDGTTPDCIE